MAYLKLSKINNKMLNLLDLINLVLKEKNRHSLVLALKKSSSLLEIKKPKI